MDLTATCVAKWWILLFNIPNIGGVIKCDGSGTVGYLYRRAAGGQFRNVAHLKAQIEIVTSRRD